MSIQSLSPEKFQEGISKGLVSALKTRTHTSLRCNTALQRHFLVFCPLSFGSFILLSFCLIVLFSFSFCPVVLLSLCLFVLFSLCLFVLFLFCRFVLLSCGLFLFLFSCQVVLLSSCFLSFCPLFFCPLILLPFFVMSFWSFCSFVLFYLFFCHFVLRVLLSLCPFAGDKWQIHRLSPSSIKRQWEFMPNLLNKQKMPRYDAPKSAPEYRQNYFPDAFPNNPQPLPSTLSNMY